MPKKTEDDVVDVPALVEPLPEEMLPKLFDIDEAAIKALADKVKMERVDTKDEFEVCKSRLSLVRTTRTDLEKRRQALKEPLLDAGRRIDKFAKDRTAEIEEIETPLKKLKTSWENAEEERKREEERKERERVKKIQDDIQLIRDQANHPFAPIEELVSRVETLEKTEITEERFQEFKPQAQAALLYTTARAKDLLQKARAKKEEEERQKAEEARLKAEREKLEAEKRAFEEAQAKAAKAVEKPPIIAHGTAADPITAHPDPSRTLTDRDGPVHSDGKVLEPDEEGKPRVEVEISGNTIRIAALRVHGMLVFAAEAIEQGDIAPLADNFTAKQIHAAADELVRLT